MNISQEEKENLFILLKQGVQDSGLSLSNQTLESIINYLVLLAKWNAVYNLTAIKNSHAMLTRHILDSLSIANYVIGETIIDVGSGAGLPGIPLALCFPEKKFILLDSNNKKTRFLTQVIIEIPVNNASVIHNRVELIKNPLGFDCILTRAFAPLNVMMTKVQHLCSQNTRILAMCGTHPSAEELAKITHWKATAHPLQVPTLNEQRHLVLLESI